MRLDPGPPAARACSGSMRVKAPTPASPSSEQPGCQRFRQAQRRHEKGAAWLLAIGLVFAVVPCLLNLAHVWFPRTGPLASEITGFWLNLAAMVLAIWNAFVHSRDAYGVMPDGELLSSLIRSS